MNRYIYTYNSSFSIPQSFTLEHFYLTIKTNNTLESLIIVPRFESIQKKSIQSLEKTELPHYFPRQ